MAILYGIIFAEKLYNWTYSNIAAARVARKKRPLAQRSYPSSVDLGKASALSKKCRNIETL
jgi:hypothetical protein